MPSDPPPSPRRRTRPDPSFRQRALGLPDPGDGEPPAATQPATARRESLREALSRIPDRDGPLAGAGRPEAEAAARPQGQAPPVVPAPVDPAPVEPVPVEPAPVVPAPVGTPSGKAPPSSGGAQRFKDAPAASPPWWRRIGFAAVLLMLVVSIPVLGRTGYRLVTDSTDGKLGAGSAGPDDPGYEELVESTPTALIIQKDAAGLPVGLTFLSLSAGAAGGTVVFVPLDTVVPDPGFGVDRLRTAYTAVASDPVGATRQLAGQTGKVLNVGIDEVYELDDRGWSQLVSPVAPFTIDNPEPLDLAAGPLPSGEVDLTADQMGPYLAAARDGDDGLSAFFRQQVVLDAWFQAVGQAGDAGVSGEMARFITTLGAGPVTFATVPGAFTGQFPEPTRYEPDAGALNDLMVDAVPAPDPPEPGARVSVRVLNGVGPGDIPGDVIRTIVSMQGSVTVLGNGPSFDGDDTSIVYADPAKQAYAEALMSALGGTGEVRQDLTASDVVDVTVVLGRDVLGDDATTRTATTDTAPLGTGDGAGTDLDPGDPATPTTALGGL